MFRIRRSEKVCSQLLGVLSRYFVHIFCHPERSGPAVLLTSI
jgi:hypothetical protein